MRNNDTVVQPFTAPRKRVRKGKAVIETRSGKIFGSTRAAGDFFKINHFDIRHFCQFIESGYVINSLANERIKNLGLHFEFLDSYRHKSSSVESVEASTMLKALRSAGA